jgi:hypothetical protein
MTNEQTNTGLDDFTRKYLYFLLSLCLIAFIWWLTSLDFRAGEINDVLKNDAEVSTYPYPFRVISVENGVAKISSPRSAQLSAIQSLRVMYPELKNSSASSDEIMEAQRGLAKVQSRVGKLVKSQADVSSIKWVLDTQWLAENGIQIFN